MIPLSEFSLRAVANEFLVVSRGEVNYWVFAVGIFFLGMLYGGLLLHSSRNKMREFIVQKRLAQEYHEWSRKADQERRIARILNEHYGKDYTKRR